MASVAWESRRHLQQLLYKVSDRLRARELQPCPAREEAPHRFLMILMQRLLVSSTRAIRTTLECRLAALKEVEQQAILRLVELENFQMRTLRTPAANAS